MFFISIEDFKQNIESIILKAKKITSNIIFLDLKNCDETKTMPVSWDDIWYTNENLKMYNQVMHEICEKHQVVYLDLEALSVDEFEDGLHPNTRGHEKIFFTVREFLINQKWI